jgi:magnesium-transporting ATPase (P-type)
MADLNAKTQNSLDEGRTLILGAQILLGILSRGVFEPGYQKLPTTSKYLVLAALALVIVAVTVLIVPAPYHRIAEEGRDTEDFNRVVMQVMYIGLIPFALSLGITLYVATRIVTNTWIAPFAGFLTFAIAVFFWYVIGMAHPVGNHRSG